LSALPNSTDDFDVTYRSYPKLNVTNPNATAISDYFNRTGLQFDNDVFLNKLNGSYHPYRYGSYYVVEANNKTKQFKSAVFMNLTSQDVAAAYPEFLYEAILKSALGKPNLKFKLTTTPFPIT
jgi:hypothetical protein